MNDVEQKITKIDPADIKKLTELQGIQDSIRKQLEPACEKIRKEVQELQSFKEILFLMNFEDKDNFKTTVEWERQKINVIFKIAKVQ